MSYSPVVIGSLTIDPPLVNGSGVVDVVNPNEAWNVPVSDVSKLGAFVTKTITRRAQAGHQQPVVAELSPGTLINAVGLANPGLDRVIEDWSHLAATLDMPIIASISGALDDIAVLTATLSQLEWVAGIEVNLSCPNVEGGLVASDPHAAGAHIARAREHVQAGTPVLAKLSPACGDIASVARAVVAAGADAVVAGNTMPAVGIDSRGRPMLGAGRRGGMSGAALHPIALHVVAEVAAAVDVPIVGLGGVESAAAAHRMRSAGAHVIGIGTAAYLDHAKIGQIAAAMVAPIDGHEPS